MTPFAAILSRLGLSQADAAAALGVPYDTLTAWCRKRRRVPDHMWPRVAVLARKCGADCLALADEIERQIRRAA